jgi:anti-sigma regulatory factor (Ser/Thr protein kinase)
MDDTKYMVQFNPSDIVSKLQRQKETQNTDAAWKALHHYLGSVNGMHMQHCSDLVEEFASPSKKSNLVIAQGYLHNICILSALISKETHELIKAVRRNPVEQDDVETLAQKVYQDIVKSAAKAPSQDLIRGPSSLDEIAESYWQHLTDIRNYLPHLTKLSEYFKFNEEQKALMEKIQRQGESLIYRNNKMFSPHFQTYKYLFSQELLAFRQESHDDFELTHGITIEYKGLQELETKTDFFNEVVEPLLNNIKDHAYQKESAKKIARVTAKHITHNQRQFYEVVVEDFGRGIKLEDVPFIFEDSFSTKKGRADVNGIGLFGVQHYVEDVYHGSITVNSHFGKGTQFIVRIPVSSCSGYACYQ